MLSAVTFDFWGTLYQNAFAKEERLLMLQEALAQHHQPRSLEDLTTAYEHTSSVWSQVWQEEHRPLPITHWLGEILMFLEASLPTSVMTDLGQDVEQVFLQGDTPHPVPGVAEVLPRLSRRYRLGLISDTGLTPGRVLRRILQRDGLLRCFDALTFSDETGATKPFPEQFLRTLEGLGVDPAEAAHVGDLPETDVIGAQQAGMKSVLFLGVSDRQDGIPLADAAFETYDELETLLERLS
ncbi:MAG TPA: HAD family hydrolase [Chloroflexi bacterium]|nr:HAD family hydrolase [Chloroflexota bacterium]